MGERSGPLRACQMYLRQEPQGLHYHVPREVLCEDVTQGGCAPIDDICDFRAIGRMVLGRAAAFEPAAPEPQVHWLLLEACITRIRWLDDGHNTASTCACYFLSSEMQVGPHMQMCIASAVGPTT